MKLICTERKMQCGAVGKLTRLTCRDTRWQVHRWFLQDTAFLLGTINAAVCLTCLVYIGPKMRRSLFCRERKIQFSDLGKVDAVHLQRDQTTGTPSPLLCSWNRIRGRPFTMLRVTFEILTPPSPLHTNVTHFYTETLGEMLRWCLTPPSPLEKCYA